MFRHRISENVSRKTYFDWSLLAFAAGCVNTGGYLACHRFVTHVTGFATLAGVAAAEGSGAHALQILSVPIYFLLGVMTSAFLIERKINQNKVPQYALVMSLVAGLLTLSGLGGYFGWFGEFGGAEGTLGDYLLLSLLCMASGIQNAALTSSSGATLRTTHLTGITTDLGIGLMRLTSLSRKDNQHHQELRANFLRVGTIVAFMLGSAIGAVAFLRWNYLGFLLPALIAFYTVSVALRERRGNSVASL